MHGPIKVKSPNNTSKWQMGFNLAFKGLTCNLTTFNKMFPSISDKFEDQIIRVRKQATEITISVCAATEIVSEAWCSRAFEISLFFIHLPIVNSQLKLRCLKRHL
jgi:hypothetical protein